MLSGVFRTAIATVGCSCYGDLLKLFSFDPLCFAVIDSNVYSMARFRMLFANIHNYAGRSDSLGIIVSPAKRSVSSILLCVGLPAGVVLAELPFHDDLEPSRALAPRLS